jgi:predicted Ser/Thr protein kinase
MNKHPESKNNAANVKSALENLVENLNTKEVSPSLTFDEYLNSVHGNPYLLLRNIFQLFDDMIEHYVGHGVDSSPNDPDLNIVYFDCSKMLVKDLDMPFYADKFLANQIVSLAKSFRSGNQQNKIYMFKGSPGSGKTTFLNNLLSRVEEYSQSDAGIMYETLWKLDKAAINSDLNGVLEVPCPSHDNPLLIIPKTQRKKFIEDIITDEEFKKKLFNEKQYEWLLKGEPCTACSSLYHALIDRVGVDKTLKMLYARRRNFSRKTGTGISVYNASDQMPRDISENNEALQSALNELFADSNKIKYKFSQYAKTNDGVLVLMDIKEQNVQRLKALHGIITDSVHKVGDIEERINTLFFAIMNPEDEKSFSDINSFKDRIRYIQVPYVLDYAVESQIYKQVFGDSIESKFLPRVLNNLSKIVLSTRMKNEPSLVMKYWLSDSAGKDNSAKYSKYADKNLLLLKMDLYRGVMPRWVSEEDKRKYNAFIKKALMTELEGEGMNGLTGRQSIKFFDAFISRYGRDKKLINMGMVRNFIVQLDVRNFPPGFVDAVMAQYNSEVLEEVKSSMYRSNTEQLSRDVQNYMFAISYNPGTTVVCPYTNDIIEVNTNFFAQIEKHTTEFWDLIGETCHAEIRTQLHRRYVSETYTQEMGIEKKPITQTTLYKEILQAYADGLKRNVLAPLQANRNFRSAISDYGALSFKTYDSRIKHDIEFLLGNLQKNHGYTLEGARQVTLYVIDDVLSRS